MKFVFRVLFVILVCYLLLLTVTSVRRYFDEEDLNKARTLFQNYRLSQTSPHLKNTLQDLECSFELVSRYEGKVRVSCFPKKENNKGAARRAPTFVWEIDVISARLVPQNDLAEKLYEN